MLQIAGGIILAVFFFMALPYLIEIGALLLIGAIRIAPTVAVIVAVVAPIIYFDSPELRAFLGYSFGLLMLSLVVLAFIFDFRKNIKSDAKEWKENKFKICPQCTKQNSEMNFECQDCSSLNKENPYWNSKDPDIDVHEIVRLRLKGSIFKGQM